MSEDNRSSRSVTNYFEYSSEEMKRDRSINWNERKTRDMVQAVANTINAELTLQKQIDNTAERYELPRDEINAFLEKEYQDELSSEYLVDGAILTCTNSTKEEQCFEFAGDPFINRYFAKEDPSIDTSSIEGWDNDKVAGRLIVTENPTAEANNLKYATVADSIGNDKNNFSGKYNIPCFGNCKRRPDSDLEMNIFHQIHKDENGFEKRKEGTCKYLMKLEKEWENYDLIRNYISYGDDKQGDKPGITMTSILFCKHGGFIYPVTSGQTIKQDNLKQRIRQETEEYMLEEPDHSNPEEVKRFMWNFFREAGFSEYAVAGILGNVYAETGGTFDPGRISPYGYYGLFQCGKERKKKMVDKGEEERGEGGWINVRFQCDFAMDEYEGGSDTGWLTRYLQLDNGDIWEGSRENFENAQSATEAALLWATSFERCYESLRTEDGKIIFEGLQHQEIRQMAAEEIYNEFAQDR